MALLAVIVLQYFLANLPFEIDIADPSYKATPAIAKANLEELVIEDPAFDANRVLFSRASSNEFVNAHFDKAQLSGETLRQYQEKSPPAPSDPQTIDLSTENVLQRLNDERARRGQPPLPAAPAGKCRSEVTAELAPTATPPKRIHMYLPEESNATRDIYMVVDAALLITLDFSPEVQEGRLNPWVPGCGKYFKVGEWEWHVATSDSFELLIAPNSILHFTFLRTADSSWKNAADPLEAFVLGSKPLRAKMVSVDTLKLGQPPADPTPSPPRFRATAAKGQLLNLERVEASAGDVRLPITGKGWVQREGNYVTEDIFDRLKKYRLISLLLGMVDLALLGWFLKIVKGAFFAPTGGGSN